MFRSTSCTLLLCLLAAGLATAQQPAPASAIVYDTASVKPNKDGGDNVDIDVDRVSYRAKNVELKSLLLSAYGLQTDQQIQDLPGWAKSARYDIQAKITEEDLKTLQALPREARQEQRSAMMRALLADRFGLKIHHATRDLPEYALVVAKGGPKLKAADPATIGSNGMSVNNTHLVGTGITPVRFAVFLANQVERPVVDRTGLTGRYDMELTWSRDTSAEPSADGSTATPPPILMTAIEEQLGLHLESTHGPVDTIVVDHIEQPSEN